MAYIKEKIDLLPIKLSRLEVVDVVPVAGDWDLTVTDIVTNRRRHMTVLTHMTSLIGGGYVFAPGFSYMVWHHESNNYPNCLIIKQSRVFRTAEDCAGAVYEEGTGTWTRALRGYELEELSKTPRNTFRYFTNVPEPTRRGRR